jgi:hypothetical protein
MSHEPTPRPQDGAAPVPRGGDQVVKAQISNHADASRLTADGSAGFLLADRLRTRDRVTARWRHRRLDVALAAGAPAEATAALSQRARRLSALSTRRALAAALRRIVRRAHEGASPGNWRIAPCHSHVLAASDELSHLADSLFRAGPVAARGVAQARILLTDGTGALYNPRSPGDLQALAASAARNLRPWGA